MALVLAWPATASAESYASAGSKLAGNLPAALHGDSEIERLTNAYLEARSGLDEAEAKVAELQGRIDEVETLLPEQEARSDAAAKQIYIMQSNPLDVAEPLLSSQSLGDFLRHVDTLELMSRRFLRELNQTREMHDQLERTREEQEKVRADAQAIADEALAPLAALQDERENAQRSGQSNASLQAQLQGGEKSVGLAASGVKQPKDYKEEATQNTEALIDGADWHADRDTFIAEWSKRIDAYLEGSSLAGQGVNFAASAWKWGIDPRWSPAISNTESSKGAYCIRPHNAWGWGAADSDPYGLASEWNSWEEAIDAHVKGLANGYGYTISMRGAMSYCPNTWQSWYNKTLAQMAQI